MDTGQALARAAYTVSNADALVFSAGAGMGVDSGLPDFRGDQGFWKAYPAYARLGLRFVELANPHWFRADPSLAWGFYGHRRNLYRRTVPHAGFGILLRWARARPAGFFIVTSNVDGHFQKAGFPVDRIVEVHGSLEHQQCRIPCQQKIWSAAAEELRVDAETFRAAEPLPRCDACGGLARPNVLMFGDGDWVSDRTDAQHARLGSWLANLPTAARVVVVECGAGTAVPTIRNFSERLVRTLGATLIRINLREPAVLRIRDGPEAIPLAMGALDALSQIDTLMNTAIQAS